jgi:cytochrome c oxidase subunit 3
LEHQGSPLIEQVVLPSTLSPPRRQQVLSNGVLGMTLFVVAEAMLFAGLISAFVIAKANQLSWPPVGQPRLPVDETAFNTVALLLSGVFLFVAARAFSRDIKRARSQVVEIESGAAGARTPLLISILLGAFFVLFQGGEWIALLSEGLTITSSQHGGFFYLIVGVHGLHAVGALILLSFGYAQLLRGTLTPSLFGAGQVFWYFVVGLWPIIYVLVYL